MNLYNYFSDVDSNLELEVHGNSSVQVNISEGNVSFTREEDWYGSETINFSVSDGEYEVFSNDLQVYSIRIDRAPPTIELILPEDNYLFTESRSVEINFTAQDDIDTELDCSVYLNGVKTLITEETFTFNNLEDGTYEWKVECSDGSNVKESESRIFLISAPDAPKLNKISSKQVLENQ